MDCGELQRASDSVRWQAVYINCRDVQISIVLTLVVSTPQSSPVANFEGTAVGVAMKVISPSSSSPWRFCEDMTVGLVELQKNFTAFYLVDWRIAGSCLFKPSGMNLHLERSLI
jgi:hypothetical protein